MPVPGPITFALYFTGVVALVLVRLAVKKYRLFPTVLALCLGMQVAALVGVPLVVVIVRWRGYGKGDEDSWNFRRDPISIFKWLPSWTTVVGMGAMGVFIWLVNGTLTELQMWQAAHAIEFLAFLLLVLKACARRSVAGMSARKLLLDVTRLACRLIASFWLDKRLPRKSGDNFVRVCDCCALTCVFFLLYCTFKSYRSTYQVDADTMHVQWLILGSVLGAAVLPFDVGRSYFPDVLWTVAVYLDAVAVFPQLSMIARNGGVVDEAVSHHLAGLFGSRLLSLTFWWLIRGTWLRGTSWTGWGILAVLTIHLLELSHYMCYYVKGCFNRGLFSGIPLVCAEG